jgi:hypothetical protein
MTNNTLEEIQILLKGTLLDKQTIIQINIPESNDDAFAIEVERKHGIDGWLEFNEGFSEQHS